MMLKREFANYKLEGIQHPDEWIVRLEGICRRLMDDYASEINDEDFVIHIVENLPNKEFQILKTSFIRQMSGEADPITLFH